MSNQEDLKRGIVMVCDALVNKVDANQWNERQLVEASIQIDQLNCKIAERDLRIAVAIKISRSNISNSAKVLEMQLVLDVPMPDLQIFLEMRPEFKPYGG